jgi:hypothetical protein
MERVAGIEPASTGWKPVIMPLYDTRLVESKGFKPLSGGVKNRYPKSLDELSLVRMRGVEPLRLSLDTRA